MSDTHRVPTDWFPPGDDEIAESLAELTDLQIADMLGPIVTAAYTHDPSTSSELISTFVADIRASERIRIRRGL
jgi:hypothetical protein